MRSSREFLLRLYRGDTANTHRVINIKNKIFTRYKRIKLFNHLYHQEIHRIPKEERPINDASKQILHELLELPRIRESKENIMPNDLSTY